MKEYAPADYKDAVDNATPFLDQFMEDEKDFIQRIAQDSRTAVDLGAGYGRMLDTLSQAYRHVYAVELHHKPYQALENTAHEYDNVTTTQDDFTQLQSLLERYEINKPTIHMHQNTLGTVDGDTIHFLSRLAQAKADHNAQIMLSLFRQDALRKHGLPLYETIDELVDGPPDDRTSIQAGLFVAQSGYTSKWWKDTEIDTIHHILDTDRVYAERRRPGYEFIHIR